MKNLCKSCVRYDRDCPIEPVTNVTTCKQFYSKRAIGYSVKEMIEASEKACKLGIKI